MVEFMCLGVQVFEFFGFFFGGFFGTFKCLGCLGCSGCFCLAPLCLAKLGFGPTSSGQPWPQGFPTARELQTCTFQGPDTFKNITKIPREDPQEKEERNKIVAGEGKNVNFLGLPPHPHPSRPHPSRPHPFRAPPWGPTLQAPKRNNFYQNCDFDCNYNHNCS